MQLRAWMSYMGPDNTRSAVIRARFACLGAVLPGIYQPPSKRQSFPNDEDLRTRLTSLIPTLDGYPLTSTLPKWMDCKLAETLARWKRA
jgi:hypothetical protein